MLLYKQHSGRLVRPFLKVPRLRSRIAGMAVANGVVDLLDPNASSKNTLKLENVRGPPIPRSIV